MLTAIGPNDCRITDLVGGALGPTDPLRHGRWGHLSHQPPKPPIKEPAAGGGPKGSAPMHDAYNFILVDHLAFTMGVGGFLLGLVTGSPHRRWKSKPGVEVYEYYGAD
jgi:hypothetical protein